MKQSNTIPQIRWAWKKQQEKYIVYSPDINIIGIAFNLKDAKILFSHKINEFLEKFGSNYRIRLK